MKLFLEGRRNGYTTKQCGKTMTVGELVEFLQNNFDDDTEIFISNDRGYTYGSITEDSFSEEEEEEEA